jgi:hypothetical protein
MVKLEKEGYEDLNTSFSRTEQVDVGAIIGGLFFWIPFLWTMKYNPMHTYELMPSSKHEQSVVKTAPTQDTQSASKIEMLRELKQLLDEDIITQEEFEKEKTKILETK